MSEAVAALVPVFLVILVGSLLRALRLLDDVQWQGFDNLIYYVFFPALLIDTIARADLSAAPIGAVAAILFCATVAAMAVAMALRRSLSDGSRAQERAFTSFFQGSCRWNSFAALAIGTSLLGREGATLIAVAFVAMIPVLNVACVTVLAVHAGEGEPRPGRALREVARNPLIIAIAIGLALWAVPVLPAPALEAAHILGLAGLGGSLIAVGAGLSLASLRRPDRFNLAATLIKLGLVPALGLGAAWLLGLDAVSRQAIAIALAVPAAATSYTLARKMGGDAPRMATILTTQSLLSLASLPAWLWLAA